jgi:hypothetical protein
MLCKTSFHVSVECKIFPIHCLASHLLNIILGLMFCLTYFISLCAFCITEQIGNNFEITGNPKLNAHFSAGWQQ